ncbi:unnamed protein product [Effrenium voratum]|uniref:Guanylate cyclase domain-containing protein n=1 Tax=Effrenium voratum TaxID=2562239 RepID=A0AA36IXG7_9DINO|nr:unnamed protein product [Effrenium voratum]
MVAVSTMLILRPGMLTPAAELEDDSSDEEPETKDPVQRPPVQEEAPEPSEDGSELSEEEAESKPANAAQAEGGLVKKSLKKRWFEKLLEGRREVGGCGGMVLRFDDEETEKAWVQDSLPKNMQRGAALMAGMSVGLCLHRLVFFSELLACPQMHRANNWIYDIVFAAGLLLALGGAMALTWLRPPVRRDLALQLVLGYWGLMVFFGGAFILTSVPPLCPSCLELEETVAACPAILQVPASKLDCTLQGHTACQIFMLFLLSLPFALPQLYHQPIALLWLVFYVASSIGYEMVFDDPPDNSHHSDVVFHCCLLLLSLTVGFSKKFYLEKSMRRQFIGALQQRRAMAQLYAMFRDMVPEYVIPKMLNQSAANPIADPIPTVTVLFVLIADFNQYTRKMTPKALLNFLNKYFRKMDDICRANGVTKIETVAEEYVACVGVSPADREKTHEELLKRLIKASHGILALQHLSKKHAVKFKMGMHTGEIVAGVIGEKLPRFRLFGDTINTAEPAR